MAQEFIFEGEKPARFNLEELTNEVRAIEPEVEIVFEDRINITVVNEDGTETIETNPDRLIFRNVPDQYSREQIRNFLLNHSASETEEEKRERLATTPNEIFIKKMIKAFTSLDAQQRQQFKNFIDGLP